MRSKREVTTEWLLQGPVPLPELCDLICEYMLLFEGLSSCKLWEFPPFMIQPEISLLNNDRVALFCKSTLEVREMHTGHILWTCVGHTKPISAVVDLGSGLIASSEFGGVVRIWRQHVCVREIHVQIHKIIALPGGRLASYTHHLHADNFVQVWTADGDCTLSLKHTSKVYDIRGLIAWRRNEMAFRYGTKMVCVHDTTTGERTTTLNSRSTIDELFTMPHNRLAATSYTTFEVSVWCLQSCTCLQTIDFVQYGVPTVLSDGTFVSQHGLELKIYDLVLNRHLFTAPTRWYRAMLPLKNGLVLKVSHVDVSISS